MINSIITATGSYIPETRKTNADFRNSEFFKYDRGSGLFIPEERNGYDIAELYTKEKTGVLERRYAKHGILTSDMAKKALINTGYDLERLNLILLGHNFGDFNPQFGQGEAVSNIGARVKQKAGIINPKTEARDILAGCPGWIAGMDIADSIIKSGKAKSIAIIGAENLSNFSDPHDKNSTIFSDGAGATIIEAVESDKKEGILSYAGRTDSKYSHLLTMKPSINPNYHNLNRLFLRMIGPEVYKYANKFVPEVVFESLEKAGIGINEIDMFLPHQANERLDVAIIQKILYRGILKNIYKKHDFKNAENLIHINNLIHKLTALTVNLLGNSSVATIPTLLDLILKGDIYKYILDKKDETLPQKILDIFSKYEHGNRHITEDIRYNIKPGDILVFFSVGAGMHCNSMVYRVPKNLYNYFDKVA